MTCSIEGCSQEEYAEGVCFFHYPLWEKWGYNEGYETYLKEGREAGQNSFREWLDTLKHQDIVDILSGHDYRLAKAVIETYPDLINESDECNGCENKECLARQSPLLKDQPRMSETRDIKPYKRKKKGGSRKCVEVKGYTRKKRARK